MTNVEKVQKSIDRQENIIQNNIKKLNNMGYDGNDMYLDIQNEGRLWEYAEGKLGVKHASDEFNRIYEFYSKISNAHDEIVSLKKSKMKEAIEKDDRARAKYQKALNELKTREEFLSIDCPALDFFLEDWKKAFVKWASKQEEFIDVDLKEVSENESENLKIDFLFRVSKHVGKILDASHLTTGMDGTINGYVKGSEKTVKVKTILAGGWNIQKLHFRVLVN